MSSGTMISFLYYSIFADLFLNALEIYSFMLCFLSCNFCLFINLSFILNFTSLRAKCDLSPCRASLTFVCIGALYCFWLSHVDPPLPLPEFYFFFNLSPKSLSLTESFSKTLFWLILLLNLSSFELSKL